MNNLPWTTGRLGIWAICGMKHYYVGGTRHLFVSMVYDGRCITAEGVDEHKVFRDLHAQAKTSVKSERKSDAKK